MPSLRLAGKAILITGAASGIGRATAFMAAAEGAHLVLGDFNRAGVEATAAEIGGAATAVQYDATDGNSCRTFVDKAVNILGRLDAVANIAGVMQRGPFDAITPDEWDRTLAVNLTSYFHVIQQALPHLIATQGNVVNMSSSAGMRGVALSAAYSASKHGVIGLTKSLAAAYKGQIRVNALSPGPIDTPLIAALKPAPGEPTYGIAWGVPDDVASAVVYLASDEAKFINGAVLQIDGGLTAG
jgi:meso-butanediol dehydrogenase/(S,S)-butanediol dehydrogenase/diacetyl reductase